MKAIVQKILNILKSFFLRVRVAIELHIGAKRSLEDSDDNEESSQKGD